MKDSYIMKAYKKEVEKEIKENNLDEYSSLSRYIIAYYDYLNEVGKHIISAKVCAKKLKQIMPEDLICLVERE